MISWEWEPSKTADQIFRNKKRQTSILPWDQKQKAFAQSWQEPCKCKYQNDWKKGVLNKWREEGR